MATNNEQLGYDVKLFKNFDLPSSQAIFQDVIVLESNNSNIGLFMQIELFNQTQILSELGAKFKDCLEQSFLSNQNQTLTTKFESSLKKLNQILTKYSQEQNLTFESIVICLCKDQVMFSSTPKGQIYLFNNKLATLVNQQDNTAFFSTVTSGSISLGDTLLVFDSSIKLNERSLNDNDINYSQLLKSVKHESKAVSELTLISGDFQIERNSYKQKHTYPTVTSKIGLRSIISFVAWIIKKFFYLLVTIKSFNFLPTRKIALTICVLYLFLAGVLISREFLIKDQQDPIVQTTLLSELINSQIPIEDFLNSRWSNTDFLELNETEKTEFISYLSNNLINKRTDLTKIADLESKIIDISVVNNQAILIDSLGGLWRWNGTIPIKIEQSTPVVNPVSLVALTSDRIVITDEIGNVWFHNNQPNQPVALPLPANIPSGKRIVEKFQNHIYFLNSDRSIARISNFTDSIQQATIITNREILPANQYIDWQIPSETYLLSSDGRVISVNRNRLGGLNVTSATQPLNPRITVVPSGFAVSSGRIVTIYNTGGIKQTTIFLPVQRVITAISAIDNRLIIATEEEVFSLILN